MSAANVLPESAMAIARARIGESIAAHARSIGILDLPADRVALITDHVVKLLEGMPPSEIANLSPSSGPLMTAVATSFNMVYGQLSEGQLRAMKQGIDPSNLAAVQAFLSGGLQGVTLGGGASGATGLPGGRANYRGTLDGVDGVSAQKMASYTSQYADLGFDQKAIGVFAAIDLDRASYNAFAKEGYSSSEIKDAAADTKVLGWKGKDAFADAIHAPEEIRKAGVAFAGAKTDEERATREDELERIYEGLSPDEKAKATPFLRRLNATHKIEAEIAPEIARAISDNSLAATRAVTGDKAELDAAQRQTTAADRGLSQDAADANLLASLDVGAGEPTAKPPSPLKSPHPATPARGVGAAAPT
jgi:hypothetical protein